MEKEINIKSALEYYLLAGVDETVGDRPFELGSETVKASPAPVVLPRPAPVQTAAPARQATTELAQATATACKNAHEICTQAQTLEELRQAVENFEGCALKLTAAHTVFGDGNPQAKMSSSAKPREQTKTESAFPLSDAAANCLIKCWPL